MQTDSALAKLAGYPHVIVAWVDDDGYPTSVATTFAADAAAGHVLLGQPQPPIPTDREIEVIGSHIRPQPGVGYDERRYVSLWGRAVDGGAVVFTPERAWGWDETEVPFFEYSERRVPQSKRYLAQLSRERGVLVKPRLALGWLVLRTTRLPFLTATIVPVLLGLAIAARHGTFDWLTALLTVIGASLVHLAANVTNDIFDERSGADRENGNPTQFSGGSRVVFYGLLSMRQLVLTAVVLYAGAIVIGLGLLAMRPSWTLLAIGVAGVIVGYSYTGPPLKLVYRGLGEIAVAIGFGPIMLLGAYVVQTERLAWEPFVASLPVAILIALILYVNEIPDRRSDAVAGKRTLVVRLSPETVRLIYGVAAALAFALIVVGVVARVLPWPTLIALAAVPLALRVYSGIRVHYDSPYTLMAVMGTNVKLHLFVGLLLLVGYLVTLALAFVA